MCKFNDANRLFLRGQFSLHRNEPELNGQWSMLTHMEPKTILSRMTKVITLHNRSYSTDRVKRLTFVSAEGAYSTQIFTSAKFNILVTGRMMSDRVTKPVIWNRGDLQRCQCDAIDTCIASIASDRACLSPPPLLESLHIEMTLIPFHTTRKQICGMRWLSRKDQLCGFVNSTKRLLTNDAVLLQVASNHLCSHVIAALKGLYITCMI